MKRPLLAAACLLAVLVGALWWIELSDMDAAIPFTIPNPSIKSRPAFLGPKWERHADVRLPLEYPQVANAEVYYHPAQKRWVCLIESGDYVFLGVGKTESEALEDLRSMALGRSEHPYRLKDLTSLDTFKK